LTPDGRGAVAVVRVWGPGALAVADAAFRPARTQSPSLAATPAGQLRLGRIGSGLGDEVVAVVLAPAGGSVDSGAEVEVEIQCHGGAAAVGLVVDALVRQGAERRQPVAWVRHSARLAIEAEAQVDLARAPTLRAAEILLEQAHGALTAAIRRLIAALDDDRAAALDALDTLRQHAHVGLHLAAGWRVVLAGRPNVGKSRLLNALAGYGRAIVDPAPGTTRDVVTVQSAVDGWPVELADTAGLRDPADALEAAGIARARDRQHEADLILLVLDRSEPWTENDRTLVETLLVSPVPPLIVANKADLAAAWEPLGPAMVSVSAERGEGIDVLTGALARRLVPAPPPPGAGVPFRPAHRRRLDAAHDALQAGDLAAARRHLAALINERQRRRGDDRDAVDDDQAPERHQG
jgi:tRNA modification GTPase